MSRIRIVTQPRRQLLACVPVERDAVAAAASASGLEPTFAGTVADLLREVGNGPWNATIVSLETEHVDEELVGRLAAEGRCGALVVTAEEVTLERAVALERVGVAALLRSPLDPAELTERLGKATGERRTVRIPRLSSQDDEKRPLLVGDSAEIAKVVERIARVARSESTVLVTGESGTGKEVVARALHWASDRAGGPFVAVNCAAIPEHLLESELFGHERGAFTGAIARRVGRFERADGGTLLLDEIGDMSLVLQAKVLRALEERTVEPVGGHESRPFDARVVAATNQSLDRALAEGRFREDLYYRLAVVELRLPPLRERGDDVRRLALHFAAEFAHRHGRPIEAISEAALARLAEARWPGNVRELRNVMDRAVLMADGGTIRSHDVKIPDAPPQAPAGAAIGTAAGYPPELSLEEVETDHIRRVLQAAGGQISAAASVLGIHRNTLSRKLREAEEREAATRHAP